MLTLPCHGKGTSGLNLLIPLENYLKLAYNLLYYIGELQELVRDFCLNGSRRKEVGF